MPPQAEFSSIADMEEKFQGVGRNDSSFNFAEKGGGHDATELSTSGARHPSSQKHWCLAD